MTFDIGVLSIGRRFASPLRMRPLCTLFVVLFATAAHADPAAMMMMQAWQQNRDASSQLRAPPSQTTRVVPPAHTSMRQIRPNPAKKPVESQQTKTQTKKPVEKVKPESTQTQATAIIARIVNTPDFGSKPTQWLAARTMPSGRDWFSGAFTRCDAHLLRFGADPRTGCAGTQ